ncbi:MAG: septum formation protein Maf [Candidatus Cloacimonadota bacterium]|nr:MAG: septum formation protein Maf [Candidatus Cloacimonadota bacterium]
MIHNLLANKNVILASNSPRRIELLKMLGIDFVSIPANIEEAHIDLSPKKFVVFYAQKKVEEISGLHKNALIIGADTIVVIKNKILGKPVNKNQARDYLKLLSNNSHFVYTGIGLYYQGKIITDFEKTRVIFQVLSDKDIEEYIKTNEPMDKAGAYGIQGFGSQFIKRIEGCYFNVMGFPIALFYRMLKKYLIINR